MVHRPIIFGIVGDSAAGKTTLSRGISQILGEENVTIICTDDYHRYDRKQRSELGSSALHPECNYLDIMQQHLCLLRNGQPILKPIYSHTTRTFESPEYIKPSQFVIVEELLGYSTLEARDSYDVKVYLAPPESLRKFGKSSAILASGVTLRNRFSNSCKSANLTQRSLSVPSASGQM